MWISSLDIGLKILKLVFCLKKVHKLLLSFQNKTASFTIKSWTCVLNVADIFLSWLTTQWANWSSFHAHLPLKFFSISCFKKNAFIFQVGLTPVWIAINCFAFGHNLCRNRFRNIQHCLSDKSVLWVSQKDAATRIFHWENAHFKSNTSQISFITKLFGSNPDFDLDFNSFWPFWWNFIDFKISYFWY